MRVLAHFSRWLACEHHAVAEPDETMVDRFAAGSRRPVTKRAFRRVLANLLGRGVVTAPPPLVSATPLDNLLDEGAPSRRGT